MWIFRSLEYFLAKDEVTTYASDDLNTKFLPDRQEDESQRWNVDFLMLPSFSATNLLSVTMDRTLTNIFPLSLVERPASFTSAVFTVLDVAHKINDATAKSSLDISLDEIHQKINVLENNLLENPILTHPVNPPPAWKTIIVLGLDLYSKVYELSQWFKE